MKKIQTAIDVQGIGVERFTANVMRSRRTHLKLPDQMSEQTVDAEINHGKWIVKCPFCAGAEMADMNDPRFFCLSCYNQESSDWLQVTFPKDRQKIEVELLKREQKNQHWLPGETLTKLRKENKERGI